MKWDCFICHASEDKETFVRPLVDALEAKGLRVWYDEFTLKKGDSLRESIDYGLLNSKFGIVILSNNFFTKKWTKLELNGLFQREEVSGQIILPVWHNITRDEVASYSPILADRIAVLSKDGLDHVVNELLDSMNGISISDLKRVRLIARLTVLTEEAKKTNKIIEALENRIKELETQIETQEVNDTRIEELNIKIQELESSKPKIKELESERGKVFVEIKEISKQIRGFVFRKSTAKIHRYDFSPGGAEYASKFFKKWYSQKGELLIYCTDLYWLESIEYEKVLKVLRSKGKNLRLYLKTTNDAITFDLESHGASIYRIKPELMTSYKLSILLNDGKNSMLIRNNELETKWIVIEEYQNNPALINLALDMLDESTKPNDSDSNKGDEIS